MHSPLPLAVSLYWVFSGQRDSRQHNAVSFLASNPDEPNPIGPLEKRNVPRLCDLVGQTLWSKVVQADPGCLTLVCDLSIAGNAGSSSERAWVVFCCFCCVVCSYRILGKADHSFTGALLGVCVSNCVASRNLNNEAI